MTLHPGRRNTLLLLAGLAVPAFARAQDAPAVPPVAVPPLPPIATPVTPGSVHPTAPAPIGAMDKGKAYFLFFDQAIDVASIRALRKQLTQLVEGGVSDITLVIDSPGGSVEQALASYSFIRALPARISTHAQVLVAPSATLLFLAGQDRSADGNARFLFHPSQAVLSGQATREQMQERLDAFGIVNDMMHQLYKERTRLADAEIERFTRETVILDAEQARDAGVVQTVADLRLPVEDKARILFLD